VPFVVRWGTARAQALRSGRGLVRGTVIVWPQAGRVSTIGRDFARPRRGEVLVRVTASAISPGTERAFYLSLPNAAASFPSFPGYSLAGTIVEVGKGVSRLKPGDHVALAAPHGSVAVAKAAEVFPIPEGVAAEDAAFVQLGIIALHAFRNAQVRPGEPVAVLGQGLIGQLVAQMAAAFGADPVISVARSGRRLTASLRRAARIIVTERDGIGEMEALGVPVTFEATGSPDGIPLALRCTGTGGRIILAGSTRGVTERTDFGLLADKRVAIVGAHISSLADDARPACAQTFFDLIEQKRIDVSSLISHRVHPCEAEWFYRRMAGSADTTIGAVFCWDRLTPAQRMRRIAFVAPPDLSPLRHQAMTQQPLAARMRAARDGVVHS
jgi:2-desacetyl-2-hydroxyethyl bacteriochlorophyllide A dehydrogenase